MTPTTEDTPDVEEQVRERSATAAETRWQWEQEIRDRGPDDKLTRLVLFTLATFMSGDGSDCRPGQRRLATATCLSRNTVRDRLERAEATGWLTIRERWEEDTRKSDLYLPVIPPPQGESDEIDDEPGWITQDEPGGGSSAMNQGGSAMAEPNQNSTRPEDHNTHNTSGAHAREARGTPVREDPSEGPDGRSEEAGQDGVPDLDLTCRSDGELTDDSLDRLWKWSHDREPTFQRLTDLVLELLHLGDRTVKVDGDRVTMAREGRIVQQQIGFSSAERVRAFIWGTALLRRDGELAGFIGPGEPATMKLAEVTDGETAFVWRARTRYEQGTQRRLDRRLSSRDEGQPDPVAEALAELGDAFSAPTAEVA